MVSTRLCTFHVGPLTLGVDISRVDEVLRERQLTPVPLADPCVVGLLNLRGRIITVIDARQRLGVAPDERQGSTHVVIRVGGEAISLLVDREGEVVDADDAAFEELPETVSPTIRRFVTGAYKLDGCLLLVLDPDSALAVSA
jgi:purine-binding chemotaxis protein CheW